jgi:hypothetical protein
MGASRLGCVINLRGREFHMSAMNERAADAAAIRPFTF